MVVTAEYSVCILIAWQVKHVNVDMVIFLRGTKFDISLFEALSPCGMNSTMLIRNVDWVCACDSCRRCSTSKEPADRVHGYNQLLSYLP